MPSKNLKALHKQLVKEGGGPFVMVAHSGWTDDVRHVVGNLVPVVACARVRPGTCLLLDLAPLIPGPYDTPSPLVKSITDEEAG